VDDPDLAFTFSVRHYEEPAVTGLTEAQEPCFARRMVGIGNRELERIAEHRRGFWESYAVFREVLVGLRRIPFELHVGSLPSSADQRGAGQGLLGSTG